MTVRAHTMFTTFDPTSNAVITAATVNIYNPGTVTPISPTIFDKNGNPLSNPLTSDATTGLVDFYLTVAQEVDVVVSKTGFTTRTYSNVPVLDDSSLELTALLTTTGDTVYASSANTPVRLPIGTNNYVMNVTGGVPKWTSALQVSDANGSAAVGGAASTSVGLNVIPSSLSTNTQYGISCVPVFASSATSFAIGMASAVTTAASSFTVANGYAIQAGAPSLGASSTITSQYGLRVENQGASGVTNAYGIYIVAQSGAATTNIGLYNNGPSDLVGNVGIGGGYSTQYGLDILSSAMTGSTQAGISCAPTVSSAATVTAAGIAAAVQTAAASFTVANSYTYLANGPTLGAASAITNQTGFYAGNQGASGITNAYGVFIAAQSGATSNIGLYVAQGTTTTGVQIAASGSGTPLYISNGGTANLIRLDGTMPSTVGAAGGASALPATPLGYINVSINGTAAKIPFYNS